MTGDEENTTLPEMVQMELSSQAIELRDLWEKLMANLGIPSLVGVSVTLAIQAQANGTGLAVHVSTIPPLEELKLVQQRLQTLRAAAKRSRGKGGNHGRPN